MLKQFIGLVVTTGMRLTAVFCISYDCETVFDRISACTNAVYLSLKSNVFVKLDILVLHE